nr:hypothetical protein [Tanacetum cinerariifolium]
GSEAGRLELAAFSKCHPGNPSSREVACDQMNWSREL